MTSDTICTRRNVRLLNIHCHGTTFCSDLSYPLDIRRRIAKRYTSTTRKKQRRRAEEQKKKVVTKTSTSSKQSVDDEEEYEKPCMENGFGGVIYEPRLGYENGLYGEASYGCSYDRHPEDPDDYLDIWEIETLIEQRVHCKLVKDYDMANTIRQELLVLHGVYLYDKRSIWTTRPELLQKMAEMVSDEADKDHEVILDLNFTKRRRR